MVSELGKQVEKIELRTNYVPLILILAAAVAVISGIVLVTGSARTAIWIAILGAIPVVFVIVSAVLSWLFTSLIGVTVHESGIALHYKTQTKAVLWDNVVAVQANSYSETAYLPSPDVASMMAVSSLAIIEVYSRLRNPGGAYTRSSSYFAFHLASGETVEVAGDARLAVLQNTIRTHIAPRLIAKSKSEFDKGQELPLAKGLAYSKNGISGVYERQAGKAYLKTPIDLKWEQIKRIHRFDQTMKIEADGSKTITLGLADIRNLHAFISISKEQAEKYHFKHAGF